MDILVWERVWTCHAVLNYLYFFRLIFLPIRSSSVFSTSKFVFNLNDLLNWTSLSIKFDARFTLRRVAHQILTPPLPPPPRRSCFCPASAPLLPHSNYSIPLTVRTHVRAGCERAEIHEPPILFVFPVVKCCISFATLRKIFLSLLSVDTANLYK